MKRALAFARKNQGFTMMEMLVSIAVLLILIGVMFQIFSLTAKVSLSGDKLMDSDNQARAVFDRMAVDFAHMVIRKDVDYYIKQASIATVPANGTANVDNTKPMNLELGNDQIAFYSQVPGYYSPSSATSSQGPLSLVAYRINAVIGSAGYNAMERLGKGLVWSATNNTNTSPAADTDVPMVFYPVTIESVWPQAVSPTQVDPNNDYELIGPEVFRFEYYYNLKKAPSSTLNCFLSNTPWDHTLTNHTSLNGWQDVASITVVISIIDERSRLSITPTQVSKLASTMADSGPPSSGIWAPGQLEAQWRTQIQNAVTLKTIPSQLASEIRVYSRTFYLTTPAP